MYYLCRELNHYHSLGHPNRCLATIPNTLPQFTYPTPDVIGDHKKECVGGHLVGMDEMENT
jgi:hypothetical protein